jgi:hypothetical protein
MSVTTTDLPWIGQLVACLSITGACTNSQNLDARFAALERKVNQAPQNSAAAEVDAMTALDVSLKGR